MLLNDFPHLTIERCWIIWPLGRNWKYCEYVGFRNCNLQCEKVYKTLIRKNTAFEQNSKTKNPFLGTITYPRSQALLSRWFFRLSQGGIWTRSLEGSCILLYTVAKKHQTASTNNKKASTTIKQPSSTTIKNHQNTIKHHQHTSNGKHHQNTSKKSNKHQQPSNNQQKPIKKALSTTIKHHQNTSKKSKKHQQPSKKQQKTSKNIINNYQKPLNTRSPSNNHQKLSKKQYQQPSNTSKNLSKNPSKPSETHHPKKSTLATPGQGSQNLWPPAPTFD